MTELQEDLEWRSRSLNWWDFYWRNRTQVSPPPAPRGGWQPRGNDHTQRANPRQWFRNRRQPGSVRSLGACQKLPS